MILHWLRYHFVLKEFVYDRCPEAVFLKAWCITQLDWRLVPAQEALSVLDCLLLVSVDEHSHLGYQKLVNIGLFARKKQPEVQAFQ